MAVMEPVKKFEDWYTRYEVDERKGCLDIRFSLGPFAEVLKRRYERYKSEMDARVANYFKLEMLADAEVVSSKPDLPNVSSGEVAGLVRRTARQLVQNTPNVEVLSKFDDDSPEGIFVRHVLTTKIIGSDQYSNDMQQNLFASTKTAFTLGFDCVIPVLTECNGAWHMEYDSIHYRDVFPEPGVKDVRKATDVFVRRYLTAGEVRQLIAGNAVGWDVNALKLLLENRPPSREAQSVDHQTKKHRGSPEGYEIITWYSSTGDPFLTFSNGSMILLRIEKNKHPEKKHPVHFLVLEKDDQQPLGKSQVELIYGRQEFQDLMLNGAMKLWYRNINPSIIGYGTVNAIPNLSPGKYTEISNPNAKIEAFEVNTGTLMQYGQISAQNLGSMVSTVGTADQQMAAQNGNGMSATPQGVEAQTAMVDITTNNYQKAIEGFFSHYCSYALSVFFAELAAVKSVELTADARQNLLKEGFAPEKIDTDGNVEMDFSNLATHYWVRCVPGSLVEMEDEKQLRVLNELFVPLSQAMPALANAGDPQTLKQAAMAMQYIISKQIELSGSKHAMDVKSLWDTGNKAAVDDRDARIEELELRIADPEREIEAEVMASGLLQLQQQVSLLAQTQATLLEKLGVVNGGSTEQPNNPDGTSPEMGLTPPTVLSASA